MQISAWLKNNCNIDVILSFKNIFFHSLSLSLTHTHTLSPPLDCSIRLFTSTCLLMLHGKEDTALREMLHNVCERNRTTTDHNGVEDESARIDCIPSTDKDQKISTGESCSELNEDTTIQR